MQLQVASKINIIAHFTTCLALYSSTEVNLLVLLHITSPRKASSATIGEAYEEARRIEFHIDGYAYTGNRTVDGKDYDIHQYI